MRVAYLVARYPHISHTFISREIRALRERGLTVEVFAVRRTPVHELLTARDREEAATTSVILPPRPAALLAAHARALLHRPVSYARTLAQAARLGGAGARARLWQLFYFVEAILLADELRRRGVRHVHAHLANVSASVALLAASFAGDDLTFSFSMHGPTEFDEVTSFGLAVKVRAASFVACIGDFSRSQLMKLTSPSCWSKLVVVRMGVELDRLAFEDRRRRSGPFHVLCVGRLVPDKGHLLLLEAIARLRETDDVRLTLVGDGPLRETLARESRRLGIDDATTFAGAIGQDRIGASYSGASAFCLPSLAEGVPVVLMEAMAAGLPVVATRIMGVPELVEDGVTGLLVPPGRPEALADALHRLRGDGELRHALGRAGRRRIEEEFDATKAVVPLVDAFRQAVAAR